MKMKELSKEQSISIISDLKEQKNVYKSIYYKTLKTYLSNKIKHSFLFERKNLLKRSSITILLLSLVVLPTIYFIKNPKTIVLPGEEAKTEFVYVDNSGKKDEEFLKDLGFFESRGSYNPKGNDSYYGKYQFGRSALDAIGFSSITKEEFISDTLLQEVAIRRLMKLNKKMLSNFIGKYEGKTIGNVYITQSGLLAAAHLGGSGNVQKFLESNGQVIFKDGNGTPITKYMKHFSNYDLHF